MYKLLSVRPAKKSTRYVKFQRTASPNKALNIKALYQQKRLILRF